MDELITKLPFLIDSPLKKHNFLRLKKNGSFVYALYEKSYEEVDKEISEKDKDELIL